MSFKNVKTAADAAGYIAGLNERWPERAEVLDLILAQVQRLETPRLHVLELCCGAGVLGAHLLSGAANIVYTGIDQSQPLLDAAHDTLAHFADRVSLRQADLNVDVWHETLAAENRQFDAIVSMQSLHDLGGEAEVSRIYELAHRLLRDGGLFLNADLIVQTDGELPNNPGRLTVAKHLALPTDYGYTDVACVAQVGGFGITSGATK